VSLGIDGKQTTNFKQIAPAPKRFEVFAQGDFSRSDRDSVDAAAGFGGWTEAGTAGIEYSLTDRLTTGFAIGYVHNNTDINDGVGSIDIDGVAASLYASWFKNNFYVDGLYSFSYLENDLRRNTAAGAATAKPSSYGNTLDLNTGYNIIYPGIVAGPIASLKYTHGEIDGFTDSAGVAVESQSYDSLISQIGWQASFPRAVRYGKLTRLTPQLHGAWAHQYMNKAEFVSAQFGGFTATGRTPEPSSDYAALGAGLMAEFGGNFSVTLDYQADVGSSEITHFISIRGGFKF
jgi:outer membrane autotransporter protein